MLALNLTKQILFATIIKVGGEMLKSYYYRLLNFIQGWPGYVFGIVWMLILAAAFLLVIKFFKKYNGTQKKFEKGSLIFLAVLLFALLIFLTYVRK